MSLRYKYNLAKRIIDRMSTKDLNAARQIAVEIQKAQELLLEKADGNFDRCVSVCQGLCCRNVALDEIISHWDFVYILAIDRSLTNRIEPCLDKEKPFFSADCIFLQDGQGPCLFPFNLRPEVCITTFCTSVKPVKKQLHNVKYKFFKLSLFINMVRVKSMFKAFFKSCKHIGLTMGILALICGCSLQKQTVADTDAYKATIDVRPSDSGQIRNRPEGFVFEDRNRDGTFQAGERGIAGVMVSNGYDVVLTDRSGRYRLPEITAADRADGLTIFITEPTGYDVPLDKDNLPRFFYHFMPEGSPPGTHGGRFAFGGLPPTGPLPQQINFPLIKVKPKSRFKIVVSGDTQTYSNTEVGYLRDTLANELVLIKDLEAIIIEGDILGDDLDLFPRFKTIMSAAGVPQYYVPGNHDLDFDAPDDAHSFDTFKREWGPAYYSFDIGKVHFVVLDNVSYPCTPDQNRDGLHPFCDDPANAPSYNGMLSDRQMQWLENDLAHIPEDRLVVLNMHIPPQAFMGMHSARHQLDNALELYDLLGYGPSNHPRRPALALSGHTHTLENIRPGETYYGWETALGSRSPGAPPFDQIVAGAACGSWWSADFDDSGVPMSYQRLGAPRGYLIIEFSGNTYRDTFKATGKSIQRQMSLSILSPTFINWAGALIEWHRTPADSRSKAPPFNLNDLPDTKIVTTAELEDTYLVANIWNGSKDSQVYLQIDNREPIQMTRTQDGQGEDMLETYDPFALRLQLYSYRFSAVSESGDARAQGFELFKGSRFGPDHPQPLDEWMLTHQSMHLWMAGMPDNLPEGIHVATVATIDRYGRSWKQTLTFEVMNQRPPSFHGIKP